MLKLPEAGYISRQKQINTGPGGTADLQELNKYKQKLTKMGFAPITINDIYGVKLGSRIAYVTSDNKWRSGGFLVDIKNSNTQHGIDVPLDIYKIYIQYKAFNGAVFNLQEEDISELWVKNKKPKPKSKKERRAAGEESDSDDGPKDVVMIQRPTVVTNFPITVDDVNGKKVIIKYARDEHDRQRYMGTSKYNKMITHGWEFSD